MCYYFNLLYIFDRLAYNVSTKNYKNISYRVSRNLLQVIIKS